MAQATDSGRLGIGTIVGYGAGDFGLNLFYTGLNLYLLYYYTDIVGLAPGIAGSIFMIALLWDAVTDPVMGVVASRTRTRLGRYRPYLLFAGPVLGASFVLLFAAPVFWPAQASMACLVTHLLFRTVYTVFAVPFTTLSAAMTRNDRTRTLLSGSRMQAATLGAIATAFLTPLLAEFLGQGSLPRGYMLTAILFAIVAEIVFLIVFFSVREKVDLQNEVGANLRSTFAAIRGNWAFWILFAVVIANSIASTIFTKSIVYYARYVIGDPTAIREALTLYTMSAAAAVLAWTWLARRTSKPLVLSIGLVINTITCCVLYGISPETKAIFFALVCVIGVGTAAAIVSFWAMLPDTVEYGEWKTGVRDEGIVFGVFQFSQKAASGIGVGLVGLLLQVIGYEANSEQSAQTLSALRVVSFLLPAGLMVVALVILRIYPMRQHQHADIVAELNSRRTEA